MEELLKDRKLLRLYNYYLFVSDEFNKRPFYTSMLISNEAAERFLNYLAEINLRHE